MRTVAYYRNSQNIYQPNSLKTQRDKAIKYSAKLALPIEAEFIDEDTSAVKNSSERRPGLKNLVEEIEKETVKNLIVYKRDRLARNSVEYMEIYEILKRHNVNVIFTADSEYPMNYSNMGDFVELMMSGLVEHEVTQMKERIAGTIMSKFEKGEITGRVPYGYVFNKEETDITKAIERVEEELEIVEKIFKMVLSEKFQSSNDIKKQLDKENIKWRHRNWKAIDIENTISYSIYIGERYKNFEGIHEPIIQKTPHTKIKSLTKEEWKKANEVLSLMKRSVSKKVKPDLTFILEGLIKCDQCGEEMTGEIRSHEYQPAGKYVCSCRKKGLLQQEVEDIVFQRTFKFFQDLVKENYENLIKRYNQTQNEEIEKLMNFSTSKKDQLLKNLHAKTEKWMNEKHVDKKNELKKEMLIIKTEIDQFSKEIIEYEKGKDR